jgi:transposase-like protein
MAAKKQTDPAKKAAVLKDIEAGKSVMQASKDHGVPSATAYGWTAAKKKRRKANAAASKAAKNGVVAANGHANGGVPAPAPAIELRGLRAWVDAAVDARLDKRFAQLANMGKP